MNIQKRLVTMVNVSAICRTRIALHRVKMTLFHGQSAISTGKR